MGVPLVTAGGVKTNDTPPPIGPVIVTELEETLQHPVVLAVQLLVVHPIGDVRFVGAVVGLGVGVDVFVGDGEGVSVFVGDWVGFGVEEDVGVGVLVGVVVGV